MGGSLNYSEIDNIRKKMFEQTKIIYNENKGKCSRKEELKKILEDKLPSELKQKKDKYSLIKDIFEDIQNKWVQEFEKAQLEEKQCRYIYISNEYKIRKLEDQIKKEKSEKNEIAQECEKEKKKIKDLEQKFNEQWQIKEKKYIVETEKEKEQLKKDLEEQKLKNKLLSDKHQNEIRRKNEINSKKIKDLEDKLKKDKEENEKIAKECEEKKEKEIQKIKEENEKEKKYLEKIYNEKLDKKEKELIRKEQNKLKELEKKKDKINNAFNDKVNSIKFKTIQKILKKLNQNEKDYCLDDISLIGKKDIINLITKIFQNENLIFTIIYHLKLFANEYKFKMLDVNHLNIILVGPCGAGKSTLINAILNTNAKTNFGRPVTTNIEYYESNEIPFIRLADSKGIEKKQDSGIKAIFTEIQNFIKAQIDGNDPDKFIHCIWYCWYGTRLEECEFELLKDLSTQYSKETIPIIIVYTMAIDDS